MTIIRHIARTVIGGILLYSCASSENTFDTSLGHIAVNIEVDGDIPQGDNISLTITSEDGKYSHTWEDSRQFSTLEGYYAGAYTATAVYGKEGSQGYGCPCYIGTEKFDVKDNFLSNVNIVCRLQQAMIQVKYSNAFTSRFNDVSLLVHSTGYAYVEIPQNNASPAYVMPGKTEVFISLDSPEGRRISLSTGLTIDTDANTLYTINLDYSDDIITARCAGKESAVSLTSDIYNQEGPIINCQGFKDGESVKLTEGFPSAANLIMWVSSSLPIRNLTLTTLRKDFTGFPWSKECDLLTDATPLIEAGLSITGDNDNNICIDFTRLLENLSVTSNSEIAFLLQAIDEGGRTSNVTSLAVEILSVEIRELQITPATIGEDVGLLTLTLNTPDVESKDFSIYIDDGNNQYSTPIKVVSTNVENENSRISFSFDVPEGLTPVPIRLDYMGKTKLHTTVERQVPKYTLNIDAFATTFRANIIADTHKCISALTRYAHILVNGKEIAILDRDIDEGMLYCAGLNPSTNYTVESVVISGQYTAEKEIRTEKAQQLVDGDMEDVEQIIDYKKFPSGGLYSSTSFAIYNQQNFADISVFWPKKAWASVNAKTFSTKAKNHNTWYMQPSAEADFTYKFSGNKSICLSSVGWSLSGENIPPYIQDTDKFLPYNPNTPVIQHISAGYLFLGDYHFNADNGTETYTQGIDFGSRPSSLNGYFRYLPDLNTPADCGWVKVEVVNVSSSGPETILASARMEFQNAPDFRAFNLPLNYDVFYLPATKVRVMFCTSTRTDGLSFDDPDVPVSVDVANSRFIGSKLWIDNLSFSY